MSGEHEAGTRVMVCQSHNGAMQYTGVIVAYDNNSHEYTINPDSGIGFKRTHARRVEIIDDE